MTRRYIITTVLLDRLCRLCVRFDKMRSLTFLLIIALAVYIASATPINPKRILINRPTEYVLRSRRSPPQYAKGTLAKEHNISKLELTLKKGEYICGDKVCKLQPGEIPEGCVFCQYRIQ